MSFFKYRDRGEWVDKIVFPGHHQFLSMRSDKIRSRRVNALPTGAMEESHLADSQLLNEVVSK